MKSARQRLHDIVLTVHRRNGGKLRKLDFNLPLLDPKLLLDSLDLAEIMVAVEKEFGVSPFDGRKPPRTWADVWKEVRGRHVADEVTRRNVTFREGERTREPQL